MTTPADDRSQVLTLTNVGEWVLEEATDPKFPFRLRIYTRKRTEPVLSFFVQDRWPGSNQHIFCLREARIGDDVTIGAEVERVPIVALQRYGRRMSVVLDRPRQKRCDFQIVETAYNNPEPEGPAPYEQIFWFTQTAMASAGRAALASTPHIPTSTPASASPAMNAICGISDRSPQSVDGCRRVTTHSCWMAQLSPWSSARPLTGYWPSLVAWTSCASASWNYPATSTTRWLSKLRTRIS
jgi:hypothetical protein